jgi:hypothetical protein
MVSRADELVGRKDNAMYSKMKSFSSFFFVASAIFAVDSSALASTTEYGTSGDDTVLIGLAVWGGVGMRPTMCLNDTTLVALRSDGSTGALNQFVKIDTLAGMDAVEFVPRNTYTPPVDRDCGLSTWNKMLYDGYPLDVYTGDGVDYVLGAVDAGDTFVRGREQADFLYNFSSIGRLYGNAGNDWLNSFTTGGSDGLYGGDGDDCLSDSSNSAIVFDCQAGASDKYDSRNASIESNCETTTTTCDIVS